MNWHSSRRAYLAGLATAVWTAAAGCTTDDGDEQKTGTDTPDCEPAEAAEAADPDSEPVHPEYEQTEVTVESTDSQKLGSVMAAIADTPEMRYTGLSDTEYLPENRGMLFVHEEEADRTYVMREMDFDIDIVYADADGVITEIHHARAPEPDEDGNNLRYPGYGQYVLEVVCGWTRDRGVETDDQLRFDR